MGVGAVIAAAGRGRRMALAIEKQFVTIANKPILVHTLERFNQCALIDSIVVVAPSAVTKWIEEEVVPQHQLLKVARVVTGGESRQASVFAGLKALDDRCAVVAIHDAVRPLIAAALLIEVIKKGIETGAAILAVPIQESVKRISQDKITQTIDRNDLWLAQTPQVFHRELILKAYQQAEAEGFVGTDDAMLVERLNYPVHVVMGDYRNFKITTPIDLEWAEFLLKKEGDKT
ncbi:MAG: 2-C-methyl-D-erythritol 4-phosphate cytidylyltransferase [candidate division KSB1 bacterium]|nr:2-C-methyl-D-erythritol 4-phosphate cytidylyltransferase [candidate division KSB1 bacterium]